MIFKTTQQLDPEQRAQEEFNLTERYSLAFKRDNPDWSNENVVRAAKIQAKHDLRSLENGGFDPQTGQRIPLMATDKGEFKPELIPKLN